MGMSSGGGGGGGVGVSATVQTDTQSGVTQETLVGVTRTSLFPCTVVYKGKTCRRG